MWRRRDRSIRSDHCDRIPVSAVWRASRHLCQPPAISAARLAASPGVDSRCHLCHSRHRRCSERSPFTASPRPADHAGIWQDLLAGFLAGRGFVAGGRWMSSSAVARARSGTECRPVGGIGPSRQMKATGTTCSSMRDPATAVLDHAERGRAFRRAWRPSRSAGVGPTSSMPRASPIGQARRLSMLAERVRSDASGARPVCLSRLDSSAIVRLPNLRQRPLTDSSRAWASSLHVGAGTSAISRFTALPDLRSTPFRWPSLSHQCVYPSSAW